ncbi:DUF3397 domain-containing protein [Paenibacillus tarimensis]
MQAIWDVIIHTYAFLAVIPVVPFLIIYFVHNTVTGDKKKALRLSMDITTPLLILCVAALFNDIFDKTFGFYGILLFMLIGWGLLGNLQFRTKGKLDMKRITRAVWRVGFFVMGVMYVLLMVIAIGQRLFT